MATIDVTKPTIDKDPNYFPIGQLSLDGNYQVVEEYVGGRVRHKWQAANAGSGTGGTGTTIKLPDGTILTPNSDGVINLPLQQSPTVAPIDSLTSLDPTKPLSAKQGKILADAIAAANDNSIVTGAVTGTNLELTKADGSKISIDIASLIKDVRLDTGVYNPSTKAIDLRLTDGKLISIPLSGLLDAVAPIDSLTSLDPTKPLSAKQGKILADAIASNKPTSGNVVGNVLNIKLTDGTTIPIDVTSLMADVRLASASYDDAQKALVMTLTNGTTFTIPLAKLLPVTVDRSLVGNGADVPIGLALSTDAGQVLKFGSDGKIYASFAPAINNLNSTDVNAPLSANQGRVLAAAIDDVKIASGLIVGNTLVLKTKDGSTVPIDITSLLKDVKLASAVYNNSTKAIDLTLTDGTEFKIPLTAVIDEANKNALVSGSISGNILNLIKADGTAIPIDVSSLLADVKLASVTLNDSSKELILTLTDNTVLKVSLASLKTNIELSPDAGQITRFDATGKILTTINTAGSISPNRKLKEPIDPNNIEYELDVNGNFITGDYPSINLIDNNVYDPNDGSIIEFKPYTYTLTPAAKTAPQLSGTGTPTDPLKLNIVGNDFFYYFNVQYNPFNQFNGDGGAPPPGLDNVNRPDYIYAVNGLRLTKDGLYVAPEADFWRSKLPRQLYKPTVNDEPVLNNPNGLTSSYILGINSDHYNQVYFNNLNDKLYHQYMYLPDSIDDWAKTIHRNGNVNINTNSNSSSLNARSLSLGYRYSNDGGAGSTTTVGNKVEQGFLNDDSINDFTQFTYYFGSHPELSTGASLTLGDPKLNDEKLAVLVNISNNPIPIIGSVLLHEYKDNVVSTLTKLEPNSTYIVHCSRFNNDALRWILIAPPITRQSGGGGATSAIASGAVVGNNLELTKVDGSKISINVASLAADVKLSSAVYNPLTKAIEFKLSDNSIISVPVSALLPVTTNKTLTGDGSTVPLSVNVAPVATNRLTIDPSSGGLMVSPFISVRGSIAAPLTGSVGVTATDMLLIVGDTAAVTLPPATDAGRLLTIKKAGGSSTAKILGNIDGSPDLLLTQDLESAQLVADGSSWVVI
jgi:hypothetical protein